MVRPVVVSKEANMVPVSRAARVHQSESPRKSDLSDYHQVPKWSTNSHQASEPSVEDDLRTVPDCIQQDGSGIEEVPKQQRSPTRQGPPPDVPTSSNTSTLQHSAGSLPSVVRGNQGSGSPTDARGPVSVPLLASCASEPGEGCTRLGAEDVQSSLGWARQAEVLRKAYGGVASAPTSGQEGADLALDGWRAMAAVRDTMLKQQCTFMSQVRDMHDVVEVQRSWMQCSDPTWEQPPLLPRLAACGDGRQDTAAREAAAPANHLKRAKLARMSAPQGNGGECQRGGSEQLLAGRGMEQTRKASEGDWEGTSGGHAAEQRCVTPTAASRSQQSGGGALALQRQADRQGPHTTDCQPQSYGGGSQGWRLFGATMTTESHGTINRHRESSYDDNAESEKGHQAWPLQRALGGEGGSNPYPRVASGTGETPWPATPCQEGRAWCPGTKAGSLEGPGRQLVSKPRASRPSERRATPPGLGLELQLGCASPALGEGGTHAGRKMGNGSDAMEGEEVPASSSVQHAAAEQFGAHVHAGGLGQERGQQRGRWRGQDGRGGRIVNSSRAQQLQPPPQPQPTEERSQSSGESGPLLGPPPQAAQWALGWPPTLQPYSHFPPPHTLAAHSHSHAAAAWQQRGPLSAPLAHAACFAADGGSSLGMAALGVPVPAPGQALQAVASLPLLGLGPPPAAVRATMLWPSSPPPPPPPQQHPQQQQQQQQVLALMQLQSQFQYPAACDARQPILAVGEAQNPGQWLPVGGPLAAGFCHAPGLWANSASAFIGAGPVEIAAGTRMAHSQPQGGPAWPGTGFTVLPVPFAPCAPTVKRAPFKTPPRLVLLSDGTVKQAAQAPDRGGMELAQEPRHRHLERQRQQQQQQPSHSSSTTVG